MKAEIKKAVLLQTETAAKYELQSQPYLKAALLSSLKSRIEQLLLYLNETDKQPCWRHFEIILCNYIDLKFNEVQL
jgi:hypothetical protein